MTGTLLDSDGGVVGHLFAGLRASTVTMLQLQLQLQRCRTAVLWRSPPALGWCQVHRSRLQLLLSTHIFGRGVVPACSGGGDARKARFLRPARARQGSGRRQAGGDHHSRRGRQGVPGEARQPGVVVSGISLNPDPGDVCVGKSQEILLRYGTLPRATASCEQFLWRQYVVLGEATKRD